MDTAKIAHQMASLPPKAQKEVIDGMWQGRKDMRDSTAWVRNLRQCQWEHGQ
jgi:hypothetical protein